MFYYASVVIYDCFTLLLYKPLRNGLRTVIFFEVSAKCKVLLRTCMSAYCLSSWSDFLITSLVKEMHFDNQHVNIRCLSFLEGTTKEEHYHTT